MPKQTQFTDTKNEMLVINFNREKAVTDAEGVTVIKYVPITIECRMDAMTSEGGVVGKVKTLEVGTEKDSPLSAKQIYNALSQVKPILGNLFKDTLLDAVATDPSI